MIINFNMYVNVYFEVLIFWNMTIIRMSGYINLRSAKSDSGIIEFVLPIYISFCLI